MSNKLSLNDLFAQAKGMSATDLGKMDGPEPRCVVRLKTNCFISDGRAGFNKTLTRLKRRSELDFKDITFNNDNLDLDFSTVKGLMTLPDGIYVLEPDETEWDDDGSGYRHWYAISWKLIPLDES